MPIQTSDRFSCTPARSCRRIPAASTGLGGLAVAQQPGRPADDAQEIVDHGIGGDRPLEMNRRRAVHLLAPHLLRRVDEEGRLRRDPHLHGLLGREAQIEVPVTVTRDRAPFAATFAGLPVARTIGTSEPLKNTHCGADADLNTLVARVTTPRRSVTLRRDVSVCPRVR